MYVIVQHRITDPVKFFSVDAREVVGSAPTEIHGRGFFPSHDRTAAICVWKATTVDAVRDYIDPVTDGVCENTYFQVLEEYALGLPEPAPARA
jgi:hypothetical protein